MPSPASLPALDVETPSRDAPTVARVVDRDQVSAGVLVSLVPRDVVDAARRVLRDRLGLDPARLEALRGKGVI